MRKREAQTVRVAHKFGVVNLARDVKLVCGVNVARHKFGARCKFGAWRKLGDKMG